MAGVYQFENIYHGPSAEIGSTCSHFNCAKLDFMLCVWDSEMRVANSGVAWKGPSEEVTYVQAAELKWAQWLRVGRGFQLRLGLRDHKKEKFDGFLREVHANKTLA